ncbi:hypothetical protein OIU76_028060 [Salix suchowensis]|nr:hypothetical protein OIU76_028060 [Salix suchowensis]
MRTNYCFGVRSFGTEGRKKDGLQVPPSDKVYEFILFRGTDIKDLQVKSSPPVQTATPVHNDPAIIQSQYPQAATASMNLPSSADGSLTDPSSHASSNGLPRATFQGSLPQYQPGASLEPWGSLHLPPTTNGSGLAMPILSMPPSMLQYVQYPAMNASNTSASPLFSAQTHPSNLPSASPLTTAVDKVAVASSVMNEGKTPSLVPSPELSPPPPPAVTEVQEPILPLPLQPEHKIYGAPMYTYQSSRGGRGRGRGNEIAHSATRFEEDFDFTAMNEKFNKEEVWGHLGKSHKAQDRDDLQDEDDVGSSKHVTKPVYVKDDFFDSISCGALDGGSRNGRARFSQQSTRDTNAFGNFSHHRGGRGGWGPDRGGWGPDRGGRSRGGYHGRGYGYGYAGRGRGYGNDAF